MIEHVLDINAVHKVPARLGTAHFSSIFPSNIHTCHFYKNDADLLELLIPYFKEGLSLGEFCLWGVAVPLTVEKATQALDKALDGTISSYVQSGQIEIFDVSQLYGKSDVFDAMAVKDMFLKKVFATMQNGWKGFRCDGMASALAPSKWRNYQTYESEVTRSLQTSVTALCSYDLSKLTAEQVIEVVSTHQASIVKRSGLWCSLQNTEHLLSKENRQKEHEFRELADTMPQLAWIAASDGSIYWFNERWHDFTGLPKEQTQIDSWHAAFDPEELPLLLKNWKSSIETGKSLEMVLNLRGADGIFLPHLLRAMPLRDQTGKITRWFGTNTDLSELTPLFRQSTKAADAR